MALAMTVETVSELLTGRRQVGQATARAGVENPRLPGRAGQTGCR